MNQIERIGILIPLALGALVAVGTMFIHALPLRATIDFVRYEKKLRRTGRGFWSDLGIVVLVISYALLAHLVEMALWAVLFVACGEFPDIGLWRHRHDAVVEIAGTLGSSKRSAHVRRFDGDDLRRHSTVGPSQVH